MSDTRNTLRFPPIKAPMSESLTPLLRRLPSYIYLADLFRDRRVLEVGCGDGAAARWLAGAGAKSVVGIDRSQSLIEAAKGRHRLPNLEFRVADYGALELEDRSFDVVCVPTGGADLLRWLGFLEEVRRVLVKDGNVIIGAPSADRPDARSGVSYHELAGRLTPLWPEVRVVGVTPFLGFALVEFAEEEELEELALDTSLTRLGAGRDEVTDYIAIAGPVPGPPRGYMVVELPPVEGLDVVSLARTTDPGAIARLEAKLREAEAAHADALARVRDLEQGRGAARSPGPVDDGELRRRLAKAVEERTAAEAELTTLRARVDQAEEEIGQITAQAAIQLEEIRRQAAQVRDGVLDAEVLHKAAEAHAAELRSLEDELAERTAFADELRHDATAAEARATAAEERALLERARADQAEALLHSLRDRLAQLEGQALRPPPGLSQNENVDANANAVAGAGAGAGDNANPNPNPNEHERLNDHAPALPPTATSPDLAAESRIAAVNAELASREAALAKANERWKAAEAKTDELWRKVGEMQKELESNRENGVETARAQRQASQLAITRAVDEASKKLVSVKDELSRTNKELARAVEERDAARAELGAAKTEAAAAKGELERARDEIEQLRDLSGRLETSLDHAHEEMNRRAATASTAPATSSAPSDARASQVMKAVKSVDEGLRAEEQRLAALEEGIRRMGEAGAARPRMIDVPFGEQPSPEADAAAKEAWLASREERIRELSAELGHRDAELAILHGTATAARRRVGELIAVIARARDDLAGQAGGEVVAALDRLLAQASELADTRGEP